MPTIYGNYDYAIARNLETAVAHTPLRMTASSPSIGRWRTPTSARRTSCAACCSICASTSARTRYISCTARRARSTSTCSRTSPRGCTSAWPRPRATACSSSATRTSRGCTTTRGVLFVDCGSVGKPKGRRSTRRLRRARGWRRSRARDDRACRRRRRCRRGAAGRSPPASSPTSSYWQPERQAPTAAAGVLLSAAFVRHAGAEFGRDAWDGYERRRSRGEANVETFKAPVATPVRGVAAPSAGVKRRPAAQVQWRVAAALDPQPPCAA